jgi:4-carboxymuconolactone decarboxylase
MPRLPEIDAGKLNPEQRKVYDAIAGGPRGGVRGPFLALLHVPELADRIQRLGELIRYNTSLGRRLSELAIITTARAMRCQYEWYAHAKLAAEAGVSADVIEAIRAEQTPRFSDQNERLVFAFAQELASAKRVSDATYAACTQAFGVNGAVELAGMVGYYAMLAMTLNGHDIRPPADTPLPFAD